MKQPEIIMESVETASIRRFVCGQLRDEPDLSTLTLGILKKRYLAFIRCESLSPEAKKLMKQVVEEELMKMQDNDENDSDAENKKPRNKRKREKETADVISGSEADDDGESTAKKARCQSNSPSESEDKDDCKAGSEESEEEEQEVTKSTQRKTNGHSKKQINSDESTDDEMNMPEKKGKGSNGDGSPKESIKKAKETTNEETKSSTSQGKKSPQSDEDNETDTDGKSEKSDKINSNDSSDDDEKEENVSVEKKKENTDPDSSSLSSLDDEQPTTKEKEVKKKKILKKDESNKEQKDDKAVLRLKHYIALCGVRLHYKKLLDGRSIRSQVAVLKKKLEDLGVHGKPSIKKCKKVKMKREETQELADLDVGNIITTTGRPKRRGASAWQEQHDPLSSTYQRTLNSDFDSDEENNTHRGRRRATDWSNLQGIISDDADSN